MMKKTTRNYIWTLTANFLLLLAVAGIWQFRLQADAFESAIPGVTIHKDRQEIAGAYTKDLTTPANLTDLKGQWALVNLWASWCPPCIVEMPSLAKLADDYKGKGLQVIAISMDAKIEQAQSAIEKHQFADFTRNWDDGAMMTTFSPPNLPMSYLIDPSGKLRATFNGQFDWAAPGIRAVFDKMITASTSVPAQP